MQIARSIREVREALRTIRAAGKAIGFVPTMGALHEGHLSLVRLADEKCDVVVASIFVNPTQFGPNEDFSKYPRTFDRDRELLEREGVDTLFAPTTEEMYPAGASAYVEVEGLSERLDGKSRPGHFRGVATIVSKLFHIVQPDAAFFGQKDAAQVAIIRKLVRDLDVPVEIVVGPTVRDADGLAMSSRNAYLSVEERQRALVLSHALTSAEAAFMRGERSAAILKRLIAQEFAREPQVIIDYIEVVDWETLLPVESAAPGILVAVAAKVGNTRLIDNIILRSAE